MKPIARIRVRKRKRCGPDYWLLQPDGVRIIITPEFGLPYLLDPEKAVAKCDSLVAVRSICAVYGWEYPETQHEIRK